ncbi:MAG: ATP-binding cassette domain-containing protein [Proteobacteria bacterium]|nr:ATP-binding cassette domain-containing protein [Desulfocapsa sp.]MBU3944304.1 ATP-binding cassette domain-containing protein [Pseudomonadota bacterium]MCG2743882.1 ATP-binding cassette domain-containing protein [Desulfobacteraceae bacterium]MBU3983199.1 ATP-binding cassette domain-containing protein [Pseudomonadota bacterium]MBU4030394.1 ATP-binding cassette domain-containing protein [Pseudomonadota bacterium]
MSDPVITVANVVTRYGRNLIHDDISLNVREAEIYGLLGGSGAGKSTLMREMVMLLSPQEGTITVLGHELSTISRVEASLLRRQWGVLFQGGALYSSLTVAENIGIALKEYTDLSDSLIQDIVRLKINMVGLPDHAADLYPAELSGGMIKRASMARALAMDPKLLFLDEPSSGLDPVGAEAFDKLILKLRDLLGLTVVMVTHDLDSIWTVVDRFAVLGDKKVIAEGTLAEVRRNPHPIVRDFFGGARGMIRSQNGK